MKIIGKILFVLVFIIGIIFICLSVFLQIHGKNILIQRIKSEYQMDVSIGYLLYSFPLGIHAINVDVENVAQARDLDVQFHPVSIRGNKVKIETIKARGGRYVLPKKVFPNQPEVDLEDLTLKAHDVVWPCEEIKTQIYASAVISSKNSFLNGKIVTASGWADFVSNNMNMKVNLLGKGADTVLTTSLISENNVLQVKGKLNSKGIVFDQGSGKKRKIGGEYGAIAASLLSMAGLSAEAEFSFQTTMSNPIIDSSKISFLGKIIRED